MTGCVKRRSTLTTTVLSALSLTTTPCRSLFGIGFSLSLFLGRALLRGDGLHAGDVAAHLSDARGLDLTRGDALRLQRLQPIRAEVQERAALGVAMDAAFEGFAELGALRLQ